MRKIYTILGWIAVLGLCACKPVNPSSNRGLPQEYSTAYQQIFGHCYDSVPNAAVVGLDLYSEGLELDNNRRIHGTGYNLYLSDIFVPDSLLEPGEYHSDTSAQAFTFLPGRDFEGYPYGMYILRIEEDNITQIQMLDSGAFAYRNDSLLFTFYYRNVYGSKATYHCSFHGALIPWLKK